MFIRQQFGSYVQPRPVLRKFPDGAGWYWDEVMEPTFTATGPTPHGRNADTGSPSDWGPNQYGYTDFDNYHLAIFGA